MLIGLISDTHGLLRPQVLKAFARVDHILHAGDVGSRDVLEQLRELAPVNAVCGNVDQGEWAESLPVRVEILLGGVRFMVLHDRKELKDLPAGIQVIVSGHSHKPSIRREQQCLYINPGSAGPRRFRLPVSAALVETGEQEPVNPRLIHLLEE